MNEKKTITHASLCSGIGGAELAASWMGWRNIVHCELNEFCRTVLAYHYPHSVSYEDITNTDFTAWRESIDVLTAGFPCQPFSLAGKRAGANDNRYLWPQIIRAIREVRPAWFVGENVAGLLSMVQPGSEIELGRSPALFEESYRTRTEQLFTIEAICQDLEHAHYSVQPFVIPACAVGAPHRRDRVWIIAHRTDTGAEGVQQTGADAVHGSVAAADTCHGRQGHRADEQILKQGCNGTADTCNGSENRTSTDAQFGGWNEVCNDIQSGQSKRSKSDSSCGQQPFALADEQGRLSGRAHNAGVKESCSSGSQPCRADCPQGWWWNFPTQSPVCNGNDGLPFDISYLTLPFAQWRSKSIEALGNAWVPQVAYEIFKAIELSNV